MRVQQRVRTAGSWTLESGSDHINAQLALVFGAGEMLRDPEIWDELRRFYPFARIAACSTAGEIAGTRVLDNTLVVTAIEFESGHVEAVGVRLNESADATVLGGLLAARLPEKGLAHVLVLSDGLQVNGSALVAGLTAVLPRRVAVTGGLSADGARFQATTVCLDGPDPHEQVVAIGLYGERLRVGYGALGGWDAFGPERRITRSAGNVLHELDGEPALDLYRKYLGEHADQLPASGLAFPLSVRNETGEDHPVVRTILAIDEEARTLTFAGDVPMGHRARLMSANFERLVSGAADAALVAHHAHAVRKVNGNGDAHSGTNGHANGHGADSPDLALLISCVGRRLMLKQRVEDEVEAVREVLGPKPVLAGFYSYGEIAPFMPASRCELHNQTMTVITLGEEAVER